MFDVLLQYLFEFKRLSLPPIGVFKLEHKMATTNVADSTIAAPTWIVDFNPHDTVVGMDNNDRLVSWLAANRQISRDEAGEHLKQFVTDLQSRLNKGEVVDWPGLGILEQKDGQVIFQSTALQISPFTDVTAKKVIRENASHQTLVGDRQTTTAEMREQLLLPDEKRRGGAVLMWVVLGVALIAAAWFFSQKGCSTAAIGNQQKVESSQSGDTYKLR